MNILAKILIFALVVLSIFSIAIFIDNLIDLLIKAITKKKEGKSAISYIFSFIIIILIIAFIIVCDVNLLIEFGEIV